MPGDSLVSLVERRLEPVPEVVELLEGLLERAKAGEVRGVAVAASADMRCVGNAFAIGDGGIAPLNLGLDYLKKRLLEEGEG